MNAKRVRHSGNRTLGTACAASLLWFSPVVAHNQQSIIRDGRSGSVPGLVEIENGVTSC